MNFKLVRFEDVKPQPWKNGGGMTREMLAWPNKDDWRVRISLADIVRDGPFSSFPGVTRTIAVLSGEGIWLDEPINVELRPRTEPETFPGHLTPYCELIDGPTRDLNAMFRNGNARGYCRQWRSGYESKLKWWRADLSPAAPLVCGVFTRDGATLRARSETIEMPPLSLAWTEGGRRDDYQILSSPQVWIFEYTPRAFRK